MSTIHLILKLIDSIRRNDSESEHNALILELLVERERTCGTHGDIRHLLDLRDPDLVDRRLSDAELELARAQLMQYLDESDAPIAGAVAALRKFHDHSTIPCFERIVERFINSENLGEINLVNFAVSGLITAGANRPEEERCIDIIRRVAWSGHGEAKEHAQRWLTRFEPPA